MFKFLGNKIRSLFKGKVDETMLEQLEELFYQADLGRELSSSLTDELRALQRKKPTLTTDELLQEIKRRLVEELNDCTPPPKKEGYPQVILIVGVNGNGKTTSLAKLTHYFQKKGKKVVIAAADTFRAAAIEQLQKWADKLGTPLVKGQPGSDPAAVVFDAIDAAKHRGYDLVLVDTAGRLHTKTDLMKELEKIVRVSAKALPGAPHETWLVLDATIGQNGVDQALTFHTYTPLSGLVLTKLDGTAKGGGVLAIQKKLNLPVRYIGTGESLENLQEFEPKSFVDALFS